MNNTIEYQSEILCNRLSKRLKHLKKWAKRCNISSFRLYDKDIPEIPLAIDYYQGIRCQENSFPETFLVFYLYERPYQKDESEEFTWLQTMSCNVATLLNVSLDNVFLKTRERQKGKNQYEKLNSKPCKINILEQGALFTVNLSEYLDTGLFFDHRPLRKLVMDTCKDKSVLNLYCYTGSFSVYSALGKAKSVKSVDLSNTYLNWAKENFKLNRLNPEDEKYQFINADVIEYLKKDKDKYDLIILDPPTFSNSKKTMQDLDINRDWSKLIELCCKLLTKDGILYFSTNSHRLKFDPEQLPAGFSAKDITDFSIPEDYRNKKIHRCWEIKES
ncbi:MAG: class I SAM-dependent methyltransferase [Treponemataceae bacterium]|nr:class I SAM-dependent methyltransferase [Treponemataceae bacterium]